jgi:hypothetical protein
MCSINGSTAISMLGDGREWANRYHLFEPCPEQIA